MLGLKLETWRREKLTVRQSAVFHNLKRALLFLFSWDLQFTGLLGSPDASGVVAVVTASFLIICAKHLHQPPSLQSRGGAYIAAGTSSVKAVISSCGNTPSLYFPVLVSEVRLLELVIC